MKAEISLNGGWQFREINKIHTDLPDNKKIADPFYRDNEKNLHCLFHPKRTRRSKLKTRSGKISLPRKKLD